jgi:hypothetical protein
MAKGHPIWNTAFVKAIRDMHSFFQEEGLKIKITSQYYQTQ